MSSVTRGVPPACCLDAASPGHGSGRPFGIHAGAGGVFFFLIYSEMEKMAWYFNINITKNKR